MTDKRKYNKAIDWAGARLTWETTQPPPSYRTIAREFGTAESTIRNKAKREGWTRRQAASPIMIIEHPTSDGAPGITTVSKSDNEPGPIIAEPPAPEPAPGPSIGIEDATESTNGGPALDTNGFEEVRALSHLDFALEFSEIMLNEIRRRRAMAELDELQMSEHEGRDDFVFALPPDPTETSTVKDAKCRICGHPTLYVTGDRGVDHSGDLIWAATCLGCSAPHILRYELAEVVLEN